LGVLGWRFGAKSDRTRFLEDSESYSAMMSLFPTPSDLRPQGRKTEIRGMTSWRELKGSETSSLFGREVYPFRYVDHEVLRIAQNIEGLLLVIISLDMHG
jgi:hypothetical protein